jgi:hypothetical protein
MQNTLPENLKPLEREICTYYQVLPRLIAEGHEGRYALIRDDNLIRVFDTLAEADVVGHDMFGLERFMAQKIRAADLNVLAPYFQPSETRVGA